MNDATTARPDEGGQSRVQRQTTNDQGDDNMARTTTPTRRRQRRHATTADQLAAMPDRAHVHVPLDRCPGLPGITMHGAHVFRHDADGMTLCTRCDASLPDGLCLACGATLYVSAAYGDLRDVETGDARCTGRLMRADDQPSHPYTDTAHVLRADDPLMNDVKPPKGKTPPATPDVEARYDKGNVKRIPPGIVCTCCRQLVYVGVGHADNCTWAAEAEAKRADLRERLLRADALADEARAERATRRAVAAAEASTDGEGETTPRTRTRRGSLPDDAVCAGSDQPAEGEITLSRAGTGTRVARCHVCGRSIPLRDNDTIRRHKPGKGRTPKNDDTTTAAPDTTSAPARTRSRDTKGGTTTKAKGAAKTATPARTKPSPKRNGRSALSAKATVHALVKGAPACGATIANITKTADLVTCKTCAARVAS